MEYVVLLKEVERPHSVEVRTDWDGVRGLIGIVTRVSISEAAVSLTVFEEDGQKVLSLEC